MSLKLFNSIAIFDMWIVAHDAASAKQALLEWMRDPTSFPNEVTCTETQRANSIRAGWRDQSPLVAGDVTDAEFESQVKGNNTIQMYEKIYTRVVEDK